LLAGNQSPSLPSCILLNCTPLQYIISHDVDLDAADRHQVRPLHLAAINNHSSVVKALVDKGANITKQDTDGDLPTHWAATKGHVQVRVHGALAELRCHAKHTR
jgi:ankyrin repeat protein